MNPRHASRPRGVETGQGMQGATTQSDGQTTQTREGTTQTTTQTDGGGEWSVSPIQGRILDYLKANPSASRREIAKFLQDITEDGVKYHLGKLQERKMLHRDGPDFGGRWEVLRGGGE